MLVFGLPLIAAMRNILQTVEYLPPLVTDLRTPESSIFLHFNQTKIKILHFNVTKYRSAHTLNFYHPNLQNGKEGTAGKNVEGLCFQLVFCDIYTLNCF